ITQTAPGLRALVPGRNPPPVPTHSGGRAGLGRATRAERRTHFLIVQDRRTSRVPQSRGPIAPWPQGPRRPRTGVMGLASHGGTWSPSLAGFRGSEPRRPRCAGRRPHSGSWVVASAWLRGAEEVARLRRGWGALGGEEGEKGVLRA